MTENMPESTWSIYLVRMANGRLYTGITTDVERRFGEHQTGGSKGAKALKGKGPLQLVFSKRVGDRSKASKLEARIKKMSRAEKERLIRGELTLVDIELDSIDSDR